MHEFSHKHIVQSRLLVATVFLLAICFNVLACRRLISHSHPPFCFSGTRVIRVQAVDNDDPNTPAGQITYSIVSTNNKFKIDEETGWLETNAVSI